MGQIPDLLSCNLYKPSKSARESLSDSLGDPQRNRPDRLVVLYPFYCLLKFVADTASLK